MRKKKKLTNKEPKLLSETLRNELKDFLCGLVCVRWIFGDGLPYLAVFGFGGNALGYYILSFFLQEVVSTHAHMQ